MAAIHPRLSSLSPVLLFGAAIALALVTVWPGVLSLVENWRDIHDYRHGYLIAAVSAIWLAFVGRRIQAEPIGVSLAGTAALALLLLLWLIALRAHSDIAMELLVPPVLLAAVLAVAGRRAAIRATAPIAYLYFAIPVWEFLLPALQWCSVAVTEAWLGAVGVPADIREYSVRIPSGTFEIVEGCSGKRYLIVTLAVAVLSGVVNRLRPGRLLALAAIAAALALLMNWIRIFVIILLGHLTEMRHYVVSQEHESLGNGMFVALLLLVFLLSRRFAAAEAGAHAVPGTADRIELQMGRAPVMAVPLSLLVAAALLTHVPVAAAEGRVVELRNSPFAAGRWGGPLPADPRWTPRFVGADSELRVAYVAEAGGRIEVYANLYVVQQAGRELIYYDNSLIGPGAWTRKWPLQTVQLAVPGGPPLAAFEATDAEGMLWQLAYVYQVGRWRVRNTALAQASYGVQSILKPTQAGVLALAVKCAEDCQEARALVSTFWDDMSAELLGVIPGHEG